MENFSKIPSLVPNSPYKSALLDPDFEIAANKDLLFDSSFPLLWRNEEMSSFELFDEENLTNKKKGQTCVNSYLPQDLIGLYQHNERRDSFDFNLNENNAGFKDIFSDFKSKEKQKENDEGMKKNYEHLVEKGPLTYDDYNRFLPKIESIEKEIDYNSFGFNQLSSQEKESNILMRDFSILKNEFLQENSENLFEEKNKRKKSNFEKCLPKEVCSNENNISFPYQNDPNYEFNNYPQKINPYNNNHFFMKNENIPLYLNYSNNPKNIIALQNLNELSYRNQLNVKMDEEKFSHENKFDYSKLLSENKNDDFYDMFPQKPENHGFNPLDYEVKYENKFKNQIQDDLWNNSSDHEPISQKVQMDAKSQKIKKEHKKSKNIVNNGLDNSFKEAHQILEEGKMKNHLKSMHVNYDFSNEDILKQKHLEYITRNRFPQKNMENMNKLNNMNREAYKPYYNNYSDINNYSYSLPSQSSIPNYPQNNNINNINYMNNINTVNLGTMNNMINLKNNEMMNNVISQRNVGNFINDQSNYNPKILMNPQKTQGGINQDEYKEEFGNNNTKKIQQLAINKSGSDLPKTNNFSMNNLQSMRNKDLQAIQVALQKKLESRKLQEKEGHTKKPKGQKIKNQEKAKAKLNIPFENNQNLVHPLMQNEEITSKRNVQFSNEQNEDLTSKRNDQFSNEHEQRKDYYSENNMKNKHISFPNMPTAEKTINNMRTFNFNDNSTEHSDLPSQNKIEDINNILNFNLFNKDKNFNIASNTNNVNNIIIMKNIKDVNIINDVNLLKKASNIDDHPEVSANKKKYKHPNQMDRLNPNIRKMQNYQNYFQNPLFFKKMNDYRMRNAPSNYFPNYPSNANYEMNVTNNNNMNSLNHMNNMNKISNVNNFPNMNNANTLNNINLGNMNNTMNSMNTINNLNYINNMGNLTSNNMNMQNNGNNNFKNVSQNNVNSMNSVNTQNNIHNMNNMNNISNMSNINQMNSFHSMNYSRLMGEKKKEAEYLKYLNSANALENRNLKRNAKNSESYDTLLNLNEEKNPLDLTKTGKATIENKLKIEKSKSINDFNNDFVSNDNAIYQYKLSQKSENSDDHFEQMKMAKFLNFKNSLNIGNFRSEQNLENAKANFYKCLSSYNIYNEKDKKEGEQEKKDLDLISVKKELKKESFTNDQEGINNEFLIQKHKEKIINEMMQDKIVKEFIMEKYQANLKKNNMKTGNLKASHHMNAEKRINNSDNISCRNNNFVDNFSMKFPLLNEQNIKKGTADFPDASIPKESANNVQGTMDDKNDKIMIGKLTLEERKKKIEMYLEKRRKRTYRKKISYNCRKNVADKRVRIKGRFVKKNEKDDATFKLGDGFQ